MLSHRVKKIRSCNFRRIEKLEIPPLHRVLRRPKQRPVNQPLELGTYLRLLDIPLCR